MANVTRVDPVLKRLVLRLVDRWGVTAAAEVAGAKRPQNAASWKDVGNIPPKYRRGLLDAARSSGITLEPIEVAYLKSSEKIPTFDGLRDGLIDVCR